MGRERSWLGHGRRSTLGCLRRSQRPCRGVKSFLVAIPVVPGLWGRPPTGYHRSAPPAVSKFGKGGWRGAVALRDAPWRCLFVGMIDDFGGRNSVACPSSLVDRHSPTIVLGSPASFGQDILSSPGGVTNHHDTPAISRSLQVWKEHVPPGQS